MGHERTYLLKRHGGAQRPGFGCITNLKLVMKRRPLTRFAEREASRKDISVLSRVRRKTSPWNGSGKAPCRPSAKGIFKAILHEYASVRSGFGFVVVCLEHLHKVPGDVPCPPPRARKRPFSSAKVVLLVLKLCASRGKTTDVGPQKLSNFSFRTKANCWLHNSGLGLGNDWSSFTHILHTRIMIG